MTQEAASCIQVGMVWTKRSCLRAAALLWCSPFAECHKLEVLQSCAATANPLSAVTALPSCACRARRPASTVGRWRRAALHLAPRQASQHSHGYASFEYAILANHLHPNTGLLCHQALPASLPPQSAAAKNEAAAAAAAAAA